MEGHDKGLLKDNKQKELIDSDSPHPTATDAQQIDSWKNNGEKARRILFEGIRNHIVSSLHGKETPYCMWYALTYLVHNISDDRKLVLKDKLRKIKMEKGDTIQKHLKKFTQCQYELGSVGLLFPTNIW